MVRKLQESNYQNKICWNLLEFFIFMIKDTKDIKVKNELLRLVCVIATYNEQGVNVNQELIYRNLIPQVNEDEIFEDQILFRIKSYGPVIKVFVNDKEPSKLLDIAIKMNQGRIIAENNENMIELQNNPEN